MRSLKLGHGEVCGE